MGSATVLVIGDDWRDQLDRYQSMEYADPLNPHIVHVDRLPDAIKEYPNATTATFRLPDGSEIANLSELDEEMTGRSIPMTIVHRALNGAMPFADWAAKEYGVSSLTAGEKPDFSGKHRWGWMRQNDAGQVTELVERTIPGAFFFFLTRTSNVLLLRPGATGWRVEGPDLVTEVIEGCAGSARLSDIDFPTMRQNRIENIGKAWDAVHRAASGETWKPFVEIRRKYPETQSYDESIEIAASREWFAQATLQKLYAARCTNDYTHYAIDAMLQPRQDYVERRTRGAAILPLGDVIRYGEHLEDPNEAELLGGLDGDALITVAGVKC